MFDSLESCKGKKAVLGWLVQPYKSPKFKFLSSEKKTTFRSFEKFWLEIWFEFFIKISLPSALPIIILQESCGNLCY